MSEFRNKPADAVMAIGLNVGDKILIAPPAPRGATTPRRKSLLQPIDMDLNGLN